MSALQNIKTAIFDETFALLSPGHNSLPAKAMLLAIALQESRCEHRRQIGGPARGFWQFEAGGGVRGVLNHSQTTNHIRYVCDVRGVHPTVNDCYTAIEHDDVLACAFARLLLYTLPFNLPKQDERDIGWAQYMAAWRPGKPHRQTWDAFYDRAWLEVLT